MTPSRPETTAASAAALHDGIAIVVLTHNRLHLLRKCVENVLLCTSEATREIIIWDNASTDGTAEYLDTVVDPRIYAVRSPENIGQNAYARAFRLTQSPFMIELDDDVVGAPPGWDATLLEAFTRLPRVGFLAADLEDDQHDIASRIRHHVRADEYVLVEENGVRILRGPAGGGCAITSRELNARVGGFRESKKHVFWLEDEAYIKDIEKLGFQSAVLADLRVHHTGGAYYSQMTSEKEKYWQWRKATHERRQAVKRLAFRVPGIRWLNERFHWIVAPS